VRVTAAGARLPQWNGTTRLAEAHLLDPLRWKQPRRIFVNSMADLFHESVPDEWIDRIFAVMAWARHHTFQILTKRPARMLAYTARVTGSRWPLPNVWLGVSAEDQESAEQRIPLLLATPAAVWFLSAEPLICPVTVPRMAELDWVIVGGESGPGARPCFVEWIASHADQCCAVGVACFVKQLGSAPCTTGTLQGDSPALLRAGKKGGEFADWPFHLQVRQFPAPRFKQPSRGSAATGEQLRRA
jgi:protein gp37